MQTTLQVARCEGKLIRPSCSAADTIGRLTKNRRLSVRDKKTGTRLLVDTGADISVLPKSFAKGKRIPTDIKLYAANGTIMHTYGNQLLELDLGLRRKFVWSFTIADVTMPILDADFLTR